MKIIRFKTQLTLRGWKIPLWQSKVVSLFDELVEVETVGVPNPNSKDTVNEAAIEKEMVTKLWHECGRLVHTK